MPEKKGKEKKKKEERQQSKQAETVEAIRIKVIYGEGRLIDCMESVIRLHMGS